jgi:acyl-CoA synthetase (NDP forming)
MKKGMIPKKFKDFKRIFEPERIAVVGVSAEGFGFGRGVLLALLTMKFSGTLYPVNPRGGTSSGLKIYESVDAIPGPIDLGIIAVPAPLVPRAVEDCMKKGAAGVEILSAGFKETGTEEGIALEKKLNELAAKGIRIIGPNCFGLYNPRTGLTMLPGPDLSREPGSVGFVSQSGGLAIDLAHVGKWRGIKFSTMVSIGNGVDIRETELLEYFGADPETRIIGMYIEGLDDGRRFFEVLKSVGNEKPVIIMKGGQSETGRRAAMSHTASIGGDAEIWKWTIRQCNAIPAVDMKEIADLALAFSFLPSGTYNGISVIGGGGAIGVASADIAASYGISIPQFDASLQEEILALLPRPGSSAKNPVDVANPRVPPEVLKEVLIRSARNSAVDVQIIVQLLHHYKPAVFYMPGLTVMDATPVSQFADAFAEAAAVTGKPVIAVVPDFKQGLDSLDIAEMLRETRRLYTEKGIPVFDDIQNAIKSIKAVSEYYTRRGHRNKGTRP